MSNSKFQDISPISFDEIINATNIKDIPSVQFHRSFDNTNLAYYYFKTKKKPIARVIILHGGGAHSLAGYEHIANILKKDYNIGTYLFDLRGHGRSEGKRGDTPKIKFVWKDLKSFVDFVKKNKEPIFLCGHSSGGGLLLNYIDWDEKTDVDGYFFISPELGYKSKTAREHINVPFASIKLYKFVVSSMTRGLLFGNSMAVFFNYPKKIIENDQLLLLSITRNMSMAMTPYAPRKQFMNIDRPYSLFIGEKDELFQEQSVINYCSLPKKDIKDKSICEVIKNTKHLSILLEIGYKIGDSITAWLP